MSWGLKPDIYETLLQGWGILANDPAARKSRALEFFRIQRDALEAALRDAPDILFVAGAGNDADNVQFSEIIPASLDLPNLITIGAVDAQGRTAGFTNVGPSVDLYANGVDISVLLPGGRNTFLSGTSFAAPQVTAFAAKLFALKPELTPAQIIALLKGTTNVEDDLPLLNERAAASAVGLPQ